MEKRSIISIALAVLLVSAAGCAGMQSVEHQYLMRGQVLDVSDGEAYLCIGSAEGAKVGQEYTVYRFERTELPTAKQVQPNFKRETVGAVKITNIVDVHYARAKILSGQVRENDVVELKP